MTNAITTTQPTDINATLRALGLIEPEQEKNYYRAKVNGTTFELEDDTYPSNQKTKAPAFTARILEMPLEYQGVYLTGDEADILGRPDIADRYCKSHYDTAKFPNEGGKYAQDGTECRKCPINPYVKREDSPLEGNKKCQWRGDLLFQVCEADGTTIDPRPWTLSLPTTGMIELRGTRKEPEKGKVSDLNFMQKLARLGIELFAKDEAEQANAIGKAALALSLGGVIAEFRIVQAKNEDGSRSYPVVTISPVAIIEGAQPHSQLPPEAGTKNVTPKGDDVDDLPF